MMIHHWLRPVLSKSLFTLFISLLLTACSTQENFDGATTGAGVGGVTTPGVGGATTQGVALSWTAPVEREDGTPISMSEIAGYRVYYGTSEGNYPNEIDIADSYNMQATLSNLVSGTYYIVVTVYDMDGRESAYSQVVTAST